MQVALQSCAMTNCGLILESILQASSDFVSETEEAVFMTRCFQFAHRFRPGLALVEEGPVSAQLSAIKQCRCS